MNVYSLTKEESDRINIVKYIAIVFVVYIHSYAKGASFADGTISLDLPEWLIVIEDLLSQVISRCGVPIFFLISSILLFMKKRKYGETIKNKMRTLLVPYLIWNTFWILVFIILQSLPITASYFSGNNTLILQSSITEWFELYGIGLQLPYPRDYPLWFIRDLMVVLLFFPVIDSVADKHPKVLFFISITLLFVPVSFPFKVAIVWFCIGACIVNLQIHMTVLDSIPMWIISVIYVVCMIVTLVTENTTIDTAFVFVGIMYWFRVSKCIYDSIRVRSMFLTLSEWTFMIYAAHEMTLTSIKRLCFRLMPTDAGWLLFEYLLLPIIVIVGCSIVGMILKRIAPRMYNILTGAR